MSDYPKALISLNRKDYSYPLADVSTLSEEEQNDLLRRGLRIPKQLKFDEEFEKWVSLYTQSGI